MTTMRMGVSKGVAPTKVSSVFFSKAINPGNTDDMNRDSEADKTQSEDTEISKEQSSSDVRDCEVC